MRNSLQRRWSTGLFVVGTMFITIGLTLLASSPIVAQEPGDYMGIRDCNDCHRDTANNHELSIHSNALIDAEENAELILGDFTADSPLLMLQFPGEDEERRIALEDLAYGVGFGRNVQAYLIEVGENNYRVLPVAWDVETSSWVSLSLAADWSDEAYDWNQSCATCHATGYDADSGEWVDNGIQCESCHGAGGTHVELADDAGREIDDEEMAAIRASIDSAPDMQACATCHDAMQFDGIHEPLPSLMDGEMLIEGISSSASAHSTAEDAPDCISCHFRTGVNEDGEEITLHDMDISLIQHSTSCTNCHTELTEAYAQRFIVGQQEDTAQRLAIIETHFDPENLPSWVTQSIQLLNADSSGGVHNVAYTEALLHSVEVYLGLVQPTTLFASQEASDPVECMECHESEYAEWLDSSHALTTLNENFQAVYAENGQPTYCLRCHASGVDATNATVQHEGVVCSSCHIIEGEHPPAPATMGTNVTTCAACHSGGHASAYEEWLASEHQTAGVDCVDCHNAHTNEMLLGDVNTTCGDCHAGAMEDEVHMGEDMICTDCHMTPRQTVTDPTMLTLTGHSMDISPDVCADCHGSTHELTVSADIEAGEDAAEIAALQSDLETWQATAEENLTSGLLGGAIGVLLVLGMVYLILRLGRSS